MKSLSPASGITSRALKSEGTLVSGPEVLLTTVSQVDPIYVNFNVNEQQVLQIREQLRKEGLVADPDNQTLRRISFVSVSPRVSLPPNAVQTPTIGGGSDLAHVSLLSGIDLSDPRRHDLLLTTTRPTLIGVFRSHGYETFGFYPSVSWDWPDRAWYGYDRYVEGRPLDYRGPTFDNWWKIPDQFSFARFEQLYPRDSRTPPRFVFAATISTHVPFIRVPPYQPDWQRVLGAALLLAGLQDRASEAADNVADAAKN